MQKESELLQKYGQAVQFLPVRFRDAAMRLDEGEKIKVTEFRLRAGRELAVISDNKPRNIGSSAVRHEELETVLELATRGSVHTAQSSIKDGYITVFGGHRIGLCGTFIRRNDEVVGIRDLSSVCIRIAKSINCAAEGVVSQVVQNGKFKNTVIISPPGHGKTTMLRDLVRRLSDDGFKISLVDERGEIAAKMRGVAQFDVGKNTDISDGIPKAQGASLMLRTLTPDIIALDEISDKNDASALVGVVNCGVGLLATLHGASGRDALSRPWCRELLEMGAFENALILRKTDGEFTYKFKKIREIEV